MDEIVYIPIYESGKFIPYKTPYNQIYKGKDALPFFDTLAECVSWCSKNTFISYSTKDDRSLEEKILIFNLKLNGVKLTHKQMSCVVGAMKEVTLQRKLGNWTNKII